MYIYLRLFPPTYIYLYVTTPRASSGAFLAGKKSLQNKNFDDHITTTYLVLNAEIDRRIDGNVLVARELSDALRAKIRWGILTP